MNVGSTRDRLFGRRDCQRLPTRSLLSNRERRGLFLLGPKRRKSFDGRVLAAQAPQHLQRDGVSVRIRQRALRDSQQRCVNLAERALRLLCGVESATRCQKVCRSFAGFSLATIEDGSSVLVWELDLGKQAACPTERGPHGPVAARTRVQSLQAGLDVRHSLRGLLVVLLADSDGLFARLERGLRGAVDTRRFCGNLLVCLSARLLLGPLSPDLVRPFNLARPFVRVGGGALSLRLIALCRRESRLRVRVA